MSVKLSALPANHSPLLADLFAMIQAAGPTDVKVTLQDLENAIFATTGWTPGGNTNTGCTTSLATGKYMTIGGVKVAWGTINLSQTAGTGHVAGLTLPTGFFNSVDVYMPFVMGEGGQPYQHVSGDSLAGTPPASFSFYFDNSASGASVVVGFILIGT